MTGHRDRVDSAADEIISRSASLKGITPVNLEESDNERPPLR